MTGTNWRAPLLAGAIAAIASHAHTQEAARWLRDVGAADQRVSETAERKLVEMGAKAVPFLDRAMEDWDDESVDGRRRCIAFLRIVRLLGADGAPLVPRLRAAGGDSDNLGHEIYAVLAGLEPYAGDENWHDTLGHVHSGGPKGAMQGFVNYIRIYGRVNCGDIDDADRMIQVLREDKSGAREAAAEALGRMKHERTLELLQARLQKRTPAADADQLTHNGFPVPFDDEFSFRASEVMIGLAPDDDRCVIAYANRALHHPHSTVRKEALLRLASFGPLAADAVPELIEVAEGSDDAVAIEALKVLGMTGKAAAPFVARIQAMTKSQAKIRARLADGLLARLRAMGVEVPEQSGTGVDDGMSSLKKAVAALDEDATEEARQQITADARSWNLLVARFRNERHDTPDVVFELLMELAWRQPAKQRAIVRHGISSHGADRWNCSVMSSTTGNNQKMQPIHRRCYAHLVVDPKSSPKQLANYLDSKNVPVRLRAVELLASQRAEWAAGKPHHDAVRKALEKAAATEPPKKSEFELPENHSVETVKLDATAELRAAAKAALQGAGQTDSGKR